MICNDVSQLILLFLFMIAVPCKARAKCDKRRNNSDRLVHGRHTNNDGLSFVVELP